MKTSIEASNLPAAHRGDPTLTQESPGAEAPPPTVPCILCGTDFSPGAAEAAEAAAAIAIRMAKPLLLVHSMAETFREELPSEACDVLIPKMRDRLHAEAERVRQLGATVEEAVLAGIPNEGINESARRHHAELIVFGCPELGALNRWLRGSVAEVVAESSTVPTLAVRSAEPFVKWTREGRPLRILVAADFTETSQAALRWAATCQNLGPCEITVGYVNHPRLHDDLVVGETLAVMPDAEETLSRRLLQNAKSILTGEPAIRIVPQSAEIDADLIQLAGEVHADVLVVGSHQRHGIDRAWHHSVSRAVLRHATVSVACVPPLTADADAARK